MVARVHTDQVIMSIQNKVPKKGHMTEVLYRAIDKFLGCQNIHISKKWNFTKVNRHDSEDTGAEK